MKSFWKIKKLEELSEKIEKAKAPVGTIPYIEIGNIDINNKKIIFTDKGAVNGSVFTPKDSIIISRVRPTRGAVAFIDKKIAVSSAFTIIKPKQEYNPKLLFYFLAWNKNFFAYLGERQKGTSYPSVKEKDILEFEILLPENKEVQQKIVKVLDVIQDAIDIQEKIIEKTKELKKSLMADLFKYGAPSFRKGRKLKETEIGEIPEGWKVVKIKDIGIVITGTTPSTSVKEFWDGEIPFVTPSDFENDSVYVYQTERKVTKDGAQKGRTIPKNSILVVCIGSTLGKIALSYEECITNQQINAIICENFKVNPFFVYYFLMKNQGLLKAYAGTTTKPIVKKSLFETFLISLPPLSEQQEIAEILQTIDQKIEIEKKKKELYEELFKTILNKIMNQEIDIEKIEV